MLGEIAPKLKGVNNNFAFSLLGTSNEITVSGAWPSYVLSFPNVLHSTNNILDDGSGGCTFGSSGAVTMTFGNGVGASTLNLKGQVNWGNTDTAANTTLGIASSASISVQKTINIGNNNSTPSVTNLAGTLNVISGSTVNMGQLTASQAVVTDSSKNLASLQYTSSNTASTLVQRDGSGNFSAGTITASLTGHASLDLALSGGTMSGFLILNADPTTGLGACTKQYADAISAGLFIKAACYAMTTANLTGWTYSNGSSGVGATLTAPSTGVFTTDGITPPLNSRIFVPNQTTTFQNGIYVLTTSSGGSNAVLTRATDYDQITEIHPGDFVIVENSGSTNAGTGWIQTATVTTIGTDPITFNNFGLTNAGTGLTRTGNTISLNNPVSPTLGGTGVANSSGSTITLGGALTLSGAFATTINVSASTNVTMPTSGTLAITTQLGVYRDTYCNTYCGGL